MERDEVVNLLQTVAVYDGRKVDALTIAAWCESATRARWTFAEAMEAVHEHFANSAGVWLMPGHLTERIRVNRRQPAPVAELRALDPPPPASGDHRAEVMAMVRQFADKKAVPSLDYSAKRKETFE